MTQFVPCGMGWRPDLPDPRDYQPTTDHPEVWAVLERLPPRKGRGTKLPPRVDLRVTNNGPWLSPVEDQGPLNASTAFAVLSLVEYFERRQGHTFEPSRLFLYQMTRKLLGLTGDSGADLRTTFKALTRFGVPPEKHWPYEPRRLHEEPCDPFLFGFAEGFSSLRYARLDEPSSTGRETLPRVKAFLASGFPVVFGFSVPSSLSADPLIPYRPTYDSIRGGQAVLAVGYDDQKNTSPKGALLVRSSWGSQWGEEGYGWLPYVYVQRGLIAGLWTIVRADWTESSEVSSPVSLPHLAIAP